MRRVPIRLALRVEERALVVLFAAALLAGGTVVLLGELAGYERILQAITAMDVQWIPVCFFGELLAYFGYVLAVRDTARVDGGPRMPLSLTLRTVVAGFGVFAATRASGGFAVDYWALRRSGEHREGAIARVLGLSALEYAVLAPAALGAALALLVEQDPAVPGAITLPWLLVLPGFAAAAWVSAPKRSARFTRLAGHGRLRRSVAHAVAGLVVLRRIAAQPFQHGLGLAGTSLYWFGDMLCLWAALRIFNQDVGIAALVLGYATGYVLTRRSLPAGGAGIVEISLTFALTWVGLHFVPALLGVVVYRIFNFWLPILPALAVLPTVRELRESLRRAERELDEHRAGA